MANSLKIKSGQGVVGKNKQVLKKVSFASE